jgi:hypothetical protein
MTDKQIIIEDCPHFIGGCCQEYLDGVCENHKCDLKIIRELETKLKTKEQECEELKSCGTPSLIGLLSIENKKLKQTLTEIKKIAEDESYIGFWDEQISEILQKISEVEE